MQHKDVGAVQDLLARYLKRFDMTPEFDAEEIEHWLLHDEKSTSEQVVWTYVVEEPNTHKISDFFSFYCLESSVIGNPKHENVRAAYLFYYATEAAFAEQEKGLKERLNLLMTDALILAKKVLSKSNFLPVPSSPQPSLFRFPLPSSPFPSLVIKARIPPSATQPTNHPNVKTSQ